jgi:hypothetical protein
MSGFSMLVIVGRNFAYFGTAALCDVSEAIEQ